MSPAGRNCAELFIEHVKICIDLCHAEGININQCAVASKRGNLRMGTPTLYFLFRFFFVSSGVYCVLNHLYGFKSLGHFIKLATDDFVIKKIDAYFNFKVTDYI